MPGYYCVARIIPAMMPLFDSIEMRDPLAEAIAIS